MRERETRNGFVGRGIIYSTFYGFALQDFNFTWKGWSFLILIRFFLGWRSMLTRKKKKKRIHLHTSYTFSWFIINAKVMIISYHHGVIRNDTMHYFIVIYNVFLSFLNCVWFMNQVFVFFLKKRCLIKLFLLNLLEEFRESFGEGKNWDDPENIVTIPSE